jgi:hypothetical protein
MGTLGILLKKYGGSAFTLIICGGLLLIFFPFSGHSLNYQHDSKQPKSNLISQLEQPSLGNQTQAIRRDKYIGEFRKLPDDPIEITEVTVKGQATQTNKHIRAPEDSENWLEGLSFKVKNKSGRNIVYLSIYLTFPETKDDRNSPTLSFPLEFGINPQWKTLPANLEALSPDQEIEFSVSGEKYEALDRFISRKKPVNSINVLMLRTVVVMFDNESGWDSGVYLRRDPQNPQKWIDLD